MTRQVIRSSVGLFESGLFALTAHPLMSAEQKLYFLQRLRRAHGPQGEIAVTRFSTIHKLHPQFSDNLDLSSLIHEVGLLPKSNLAVSVTDPQSLNTAQRCGFTNISTSIYFSESYLKKIGTSAEDMEKRWKEMAVISLKTRTDLRLELGIADPETGKPVPAETLVDAMEKAVDLGITRLVLNDPSGQATIKQISEIIELANKRGIPTSYLEAKFSDSHGMGVANNFAAMQFGVEKIHTAFGGFGNYTPTEEMSILLDKTAPIIPGEKVPEGEQIYMGGRVDLQELVRTTDALFQQYPSTKENPVPAPSSKAFYAIVAKEKAQTSAPAPTVKVETVKQVAGVEKGQSHA